MSAAVWSLHSHLTANLNRCVSDGITDMKNMTSLQVIKTTMLYRWEREKKYRYASSLDILEFDGEKYQLTTERRIKLSQHES
jgi:hypothetical protein